jgi:hypothetical protein
MLATTVMPNRSSRGIQSAAAMLHAALDTTPMMRRRARRSTFGRGLTALVIIMAHFNGTGDEQQSAGKYVGDEVKVQSNCIWSKVMRQCVWGEGTAANEHCLKSDFGY